jgi:hypothetical protein
MNMCGLTLFGRCSGVVEVRVLRRSRAGFGEQGGQRAVINGMLTTPLFTVWRYTTMSLGVTQDRFSFFGSACGLPTPTSASGMVEA